MATDERLDIASIDPDLNHYNDSINNFKEFTIDTFNIDNDMNISTLNLFHNNARSTMKDGRMDEYNILFKAIDNHFNILVFTETWLREDNKHLCNFEGYTPLHLLRPIDADFDLKTKGVGFLSLSNRTLISNIEKTFAYQHLQLNVCLLS